MKLSLGDRFDRYTIEALIGEGGMAKVYRARDSLLHRRVALKVVTLGERGAGRDDTRDPGVGADAAEWILHEARAAAALDHPNVISIHDVGEVDGTAYIAMELIEGRNLRACVGVASITLRERLGWLLDVARALAAAHKRGLVHRDVKPENVMVREDGVVKVLDFGIARRPQPHVDLSDSHPTLGSRGLILGTPRYMAPEQMADETLDARADQFAWGVVAYELLSGKIPWTSSDDLLLVAEILSRDPEPLGAVMPELAPEVAAVVTRALAKSPSDRFATTDDLADTLEAAMGKSEIARAPSLGEIESANSTRRAWLLLVAAVATAIAGGAAVILGTRREQPAASPADGTTAGASSGTRSAAHGGCTSSVACSRGNGDRPYRCRREDGACVALESEDCKVIATKAELEDDATLYVGAMFPLTGDDAASFGFESVNALELARGEFSRIAHGIPSPRAGQPARPIALVACDDNADAQRAAKHLVDDVQVPAVIGFYGSQEVIDLATTLFIPKGTLAIATQNRSSLITTIPHPPGQARLVWRTTITSAQSAQAVSLAVSEILEPALRALPGAVAKDEPLRVALLRPSTTAGLSAADAIFTHLTFNGRSALENGASYREFQHGDHTNLEASQDFGAVVPKLVQFRPHVIVYMSFHGVSKNLLAPIEAQWPADAKFRPRYVASGNLLGNDFFSFIGKSADRRRRFIGVNPPTTTAVNAKLTSRYNEAFSPKVSLANGPGAVYDAFYVLAYAAYAAGEATLSGPALARGIARLTPPGAPVDVGPTMIFDAFNTLRDGRNIDLNGAATGLDFDVATGDTPSDFAVLCVKADAQGMAADAVESGVVFNAKTKKLEGLPLLCR